MACPLDYGLSFDGHFAYRDPTHEDSPCPSTEAPQTPGSVHENPGSQPKLLDPEQPILKFSTPSPGRTSFSSHSTNIKSESSFFFQPEFYHPQEKKPIIDTGVLNHHALLPPADLHPRAARSTSPFCNETQPYGLQELESYADPYGPLPPVPSQPYHLHEGAHYFSPWQFAGDHDGQLNLSPALFPTERAADVIPYPPEHYHEHSARYNPAFGPKVSSHDMRSSGRRRQANNPKNGPGRKPIDSKTRVTKRENTKAGSTKAKLTKAESTEAESTESRYCCEVTGCPKSYKRQEHLKRHMGS